MSHELRTPLNAILGITEVLMEGVYGAVGVSQARSLGTIHSSGQHLLALINDLLDLAKINSGKLELELELVGVEELCLQCLRMVREKAAARQVTVSWSWDGEVSMMQADGRRLKQILLNLLSNAEKFTAVGGRIGLEVQKGGAGQVQFSVWDTGVGISTEFHTKIFEPFYQLAQGGVRDGTGLGLALVQRLTILHGGSVTISSESGQGSRFTVILPTGSGVVSPLTGLPIAAPSRGPLKGRHLLLVEDNETSAAFLRDFLISSGADIVWAKDGLEALNQVTAFQPDLILMDIQLPKLDGLEVTRILRRQGFKKPILALTALASPADQEHCLEAGASAWMSKPASLPELLHTLHRLLASW
jgi:CheY-like chemotaxis protein